MNANASVQYLRHLQRGRQSKNTDHNLVHVHEAGGDICVYGIYLKCDPIKEESVWEGNKHSVEEYLTKKRYLFKKMQH